MPDSCAELRAINLLITGKPGSGKGTQASLLIQNLQIKHISTGEIFRKEMQSDSDLGRQVNQCVSKGDLVPDQLTNAIVKKVLRAKDYPHGFLLDGYPRTRIQAMALDQMLDELHLKLDAVIHIQASDDTLMTRLAGRRVCTNCQETYHIVSHPPKVEGLCDKCHQPLIQRADDQEASIKIRLDVYNEKTRPLLEYYQEKGLLVEVNGENDPEVVFQEMMQKLGIAR